MRLIDADALLKQPLDKANYPSNYVREAPTVCDIEQIRAEIEELDRYYDNDYFSVNNCPMYKCNEVLLIIDKYTKGEGDSNV